MLTLSIITLSIMLRQTQCCYSECNFMLSVTMLCVAKGLYAECRGAQFLYPSILDRIQIELDFVFLKNAKFK
jgi:hypothetical protein